MKNFWKWILGIVIVAVVLTGLGIGSRLLMRSVFPAETIEVQAFERPMMLRVDERGEGGELGKPVIVGGGAVEGFSTGLVLNGGGYGGCPMGFHGRSFMHLGWLVPLALLGLVLYGMYRWGFRKAKDVQVQSASTEPTAVRTCPKCGNQVQENWKNCANCGRKL